MKLYRPGTGLRGRRVLVMGLGTKDGGVGAVLFAHRMGALVTVTDLRPAEELRDPLALLPPGVRTVLNGHDEEDFRAADLVIRNPGIRRDNPFLVIASEAGSAVDSPAGIFSERVGTPWVGVTGTKGKSYVTHLTAHLLNRSGIPSVAAGNNCVSPLRTVDDGSLRHVLELSSWQLGELGLHGKSPQVGCWLNLFPDHMNWYGSMEEYRRDKEMIYRNQSPDDIMVLPAGDPDLSSIETGSRRLLFGTFPAGGEDGCFLEEGRLVLTRGRASETIARVDTLREELRVPLHLALVPPAVCCAVSAGAGPGGMEDALRSFRGLPCRFQRLHTDAGLVVVNDSAATTPASVVRALESVGDGPVVLLAGGGGHKNLDFSALADAVAGRVGHLLVWTGDGASERLERALDGRMDGRLHRIADMDEAVEKGIRLTREAGGGTFLLSPGCSGAPFFVDLFERGRLFEKAVRRHAGRG